MEGKTKESRKTWGGGGRETGREAGSAGFVPWCVCVCVYVHVCLCVMHVCAWGGMNLTSGDLSVILHFLSRSRVSCLNPEFASLAGLVSQLALGSPVSPS